ncbi:MAG: hypothetical protein UV73_C0018G0040 [Candidatus Gottesmanbacteria bacterium GW2011_GWA2_43_14]|uniref:Dockerin domain-containing protein n=1 Tax=Candidatus Gottesmanbacteria bacterium GW2011_GWA2_43_14 TaxID=1618443 RepID=A0A0G1DCR1_9BACT|nr:MAG: hypothetical protein UV73_C0018G0040 [Candidatus Gottesmanbacteria bacterium GW2011_GWA2_43_14]
MINKKQIIGLVIFFLLAGFLLLATLISRQNIDIRNRAAGTNEIDIHFLPPSGTFSPGQTFDAQLNLFKVASRSINVSGAQVVLDISTKFNIVSANCIAPFDGLPFVSIQGQKVTLMCAIAIGTNPVPVTSSDLAFANVKLMVDPGAAVGSAPISFTSTRATEGGISGQAPDVSTAGTAPSYIIGTQGATSTPGGPTNSPQPTNPSDPTPTTIGPTQPVTQEYVIDVGEKDSLTIHIGGVGPTPTVIAGEVDMTFSPSTGSLPPDTNFKIMANAGTNSIAFGRVVFTFDPVKINLASEITTNPNLSTIVEKTTAASANSTGRAVVVIAASPTDTLPSGSFEFASVTFTSVTQAADQTTVNFDSADMQIVDGTGTERTISVSSLGLELNGGEPPSPTPTTEPGEPTPTPTDVPGDVPLLKFSAILNHTQNNPDLYFKLRVKDDLFFLANEISQSPSCQTAGPGEKDYIVPMRAVNGIYQPTNLPLVADTPSGTIADVTPEGYVVLAGIAPDNYYTLMLKTEKFRGTEVVRHLNLASGQNGVYDWTGIPLEPGDLPDPNTNFLQDCTVNAIDISLIVSRIGQTGATDLFVADVNFDGIVNGNDVSKVVNTLSTKPDDDL